jgi:sigma-E factor negative regulatory protein RseC
LATEEGIVLCIIDSSASAWVKTKKSAACESCGSKGSCNVMGGGNDMEVEAINTAGAKEGDVVVLSFSSSSLLKATFLLYVFPVLCMLAGAIFGNETAPYFNYSPSGFSAVSGFFCFFVSLLIVKTLGNRLADNKKYRPEIIRVKKQTAGH